MKPTRATLLATTLFALATMVEGVAPPASHAQAFQSDLIRCRSALAASSRRYMERVLAARVRCQSRVATGKLPPSTNCVTGRGDEKLDRALRTYEDRLSSSVPTACAGAQLILLGFPGICEDATGDPFDLLDLTQCVVDETDTIVASLLGMYFPPLDDYVRGTKGNCLKGIAKDASSSFRRETRVRHRCLLDQEVNKIEDTVLCRNEIRPYGAGTGSDVVDRQLRKAYLALLGGVPGSCAQNDLDKFGFQENCTDATGGLFTIFDLKECLFGKNREQLPLLLDIVFPRDPVCGNGRTETGEECDDGIDGNSDTTPNACRTDCTNPACHDGVQDTGEGCDDGNTIDLDGCSGECVKDICGDGTINNGGAEECDNGAANSNTADGACRLDCKEARCGDGATDTVSLGEECDDANLTSEDGCSAQCDLEFCGDGVRQAGLDEDCDPGVGNFGDDPDQCRPGCLNPTCGDGTVDPGFGEECDDENEDSSDGCTNSCTICGNGIKAASEDCDGDATICGDGNGCNSSCECQTACPVVGELVLFAGYGEACTVNADCPIGTCDIERGFCKTVTELDSGWTGISHDSDINNFVTSRGFLDCASNGPTCGECEVVGIDNSIGNCRCANDNRTVCAEPFAASAPECPACIGGGRRNTQACASNVDCFDGTDSCNTSTGKCVGVTSTTCTTNSDCHFQGTCTGQSSCSCYFGAPFPLSASSTPACIVNRFARDISGTANVDLGAGEITANLFTEVHLGLDTKIPCPYCGGRCSNNEAVVCGADSECVGGTCMFDEVMNDGVRGGRCVLGPDEGLPCDVQAFNTTFPARVVGQTSGGGYSLDCFPNNDISGGGLIINLTQSTGVTQQSFDVPCGSHLDADCACRQCTGTGFVPCSGDGDCVNEPGFCNVSGEGYECASNADCLSLDLGNCHAALKRCDSSRGGITNVGCMTNADCKNYMNAQTCNPSTCATNGLVSELPQPNGCVDFDCSDVGGGEGECTVGPDSKFCDALLRANGEGILNCIDNGDCLASVVGVNAGNCTLTARRECFLDPIVAAGKADPTFPVGAAFFCIPPTGNTGINSTAGLPGPGRVVNQAQSKTFCETDPERQYIPGVGCLD